MLSNKKKKLIAWALIAALVVGIMLPAVVSLAV